MADNFYYVEGNCSVRQLVKSLVTEITQNADIYKWDLVYPDSIDKLGVAENTNIDLITDSSTTEKVDHIFPITTLNDKCILKATTTYGYSFYLKIDRPPSELNADEKKALINFKGIKTYGDGYGHVYTRTDAEALERMAGLFKDSNDNLIPAPVPGYADYVSAKTKSYSLNSLVFQISNALNTTGDDIEIEANIDIYYHKLSWYNVVQSGIKDFLPIQYWINVTKDNINLVLRGDPSADVAPYSNFLTGYAYIGALKPIEDSATTDDKYNFGITVSSNQGPNYCNIYGNRTATGITDFCMIANRVGMPYQPHYPAFYSTNPLMDKCNVEGSRWNHKKHQFSDITLVHPVDMERGKMINVLAGDASSIYDMDKLAYKKDTEDEEYYKKFKITAPFNFLNNSANVNYAIAIRCYKTVE